MNQWKYTLSAAAFAAAMLCSTLPMSAMASGGASGPTVGYASQGHIGEVVVNPYRIAPLTAVIKNGGYDITDATVRVIPKVGGQEIKYHVDDIELRTHAGIPVFGLYPDYANTVEVSYTRIYKGEKEKFTEKYSFYVPPVMNISNGIPGQKNMFNTTVLKMSDKYKDRVYLVNNLLPPPAQASRAVWNNPSGGALEWSFYPQVGMIDATGALRWYLNPTPIYDNETIYRSGIMMGFRQTPDGALAWGYGQRYVKYDFMGRKVFNRRLPTEFADFSHALDVAENGHYFLRVSSFDHRRADGKRVHTVRDVIAEVDADGRVMDEFKLYDILDPYRSNVIKVLDQGAVCLNIDPSKEGKTLTAEDLAKQEESNVFGDIAGVGAGRNWAHVNSVDYDPSDDSIIISSRHQSAVIKIGRDHKVKWILGSHEGWRSPWKEKLLTPIDEKGNPIKCVGSKCEKDFDWTWTQHTGWRVDSLSNKDVFYLSVFDNGDARGMEQPALPTMKYTRGVVYKIDQKKMTVQQIWEYGKEKGADYYSPVTGLTEYMPDKKSIVVYFSTAGFATSGGGSSLGALNSVSGEMHPYITEFDWMAKEPSVVIRINGSFGYQAFPINVQQAFDHKKAK